MSSAEGVIENSCAKFLLYMLQMPPMQRYFISR